MTKRSNHPSEEKTTRRSFGLKVLGTTAVLCLGLALETSGILIASTGPGLAQQEDQGFTLPTYDKENGSYYEVVEFPTNLGADEQWDTARALAEARTYKGRQGRLAVVKNQKTHLFLARTFGTKINDFMWIGLAYHCDSRQLIWEDGTIFKPGDFSAWAQRWYQNSPEQCTSDQPYMPVVYMPASQGFAWQATGPSDGLRYFLVEYPAPRSKGTAKATLSTAPKTVAAR